MPRKTFKNKILNEPIKVKSQKKPSLINLEKTNKENKETTVRNALHCTKESLNKLGLLLDNYKIDKDNPDKWLFLSLALAKDYIRGFKIVEEKIRTKPTTWTPIKYAVLYCEVELKKKSNPNQTYSSICNNLERNNDLWKGETSLHQRYSEAKKPKGTASILVRILKNTAIPPSEELYFSLLDLMKSKEE